MYPVQLILDDGNLAISLAEIRDWFSRQGLEPGAFQYRMQADHVRLRVDFTTLTDATAFAEAFSGMVLGYTAAGENDPSVPGTEAEA
jgi:hypothetical protein